MGKIKETHFGTSQLGSAGLPVLVLMICSATRLAFASGTWGDHILVIGGHERNDQIPGSIQRPRKQWFPYLDDLQKYWVFHLQEGLYIV